VQALFRNTKPATNKDMQGAYFNITKNVLFKRSLRKGYGLYQYIMRILSKKFFMMIEINPYTNINGKGKTYVNNTNMVESSYAYASSML
jgi:hypothetical protein